VQDDDLERLAATGHPHLDFFIDCARALQG
jgi:hypothetical protein